MRRRIHSGETGRSLDAEGNGSWSWGIAALGVLTLVLFLGALVWLRHDPSPTSSMDAPGIVRSLVVDQGLDEGSLRDVVCVRENAERFTCSLTVLDPDVGDQRVGGTLVCAGEERAACVWRPEA